MNKRGQGLPIGTLVLIVLGIVVLVLLIIGLTTGTEFFFGLFERAPGSSLEIVAQGCGIAAAGELYIDYCKTFKEVEAGGVDQFVNCQFEDIEAVLDTKLDCEDKGFTDLEKEYCGTVEDKKTIVNDKTCTVWEGVAVAP